MFLLQLITTIIAFFFGLTFHRLYSAAIERRINENSKKKRPTPSPGAEPSGSNKAKCERKDDNDEEVFTMDDFPTEVLLKAHYMATKQSSLDQPLDMFESDVTLAASIRAHAGTVSTQPSISGFVAPL